MLSASERDAQVLQAPTESRGSAVIELLVQDPQINPLVKVGRLPDLLSSAFIMQTHTKVPV